MQIVDEYSQGSPEWFAATAGSVGGGTINAVATAGGGKTRAKACRAKAAELVSGTRKEGLRIWQFERGLKYEPEARQYYELVYGTVVRQVAFVRPDDNAMFRHYSPDGCIDDNGFLEIKIREPEVFVEYFFDRNIRLADRRQIDWGFRITGLKYCDYVQYCPEIADAGIISPMIVSRCFPDAKEIDKLEGLAETFIAEMLLIVNKLKKGV